MQYNHNIYIYRRQGSFALQILWRCLLRQETITINARLDAFIFIHRPALPMLSIFNLPVTMLLTLIIQDIFLELVISTHPLRLMLSNLLSKKQI